MGDFSKRLGRRAQPLRTPVPLAAGANAEDAVVASARAFVRRPDGALALRLVSDTGTLLDRRGAVDPAASRRACGAGCAYCCHMPVSLSLPEALLIHTHVLESWPAERRAALVAAISAGDREAAALDDAALFLSGRACVFLAPIGAARSTPCARWPAAGTPPSSARPAPTPMRSPPTPPAPLALRPTTGCATRRTG